MIPEDQKNMTKFYEHLFNLYYIHVESVDATEHSMCVIKIHKTTFSLLIHVFFLYRAHAPNSSRLFKLYINKMEKKLFIVLLLRVLFKYFQDAYKWL